MNLIILTEQDRLSDGTFRLQDERFRHICSVLSAQTGDMLRVGILDGPIGSARVESLTDSQVTLRCEALEDPPDDPLAVDLICAVPRPKTIRKVYGIAAAMGVREIHFVRANRTDKSYLNSPLLEPEGYLPCLVDGLAQARRTRLPKIFVHPLFRPFVEDDLPELGREPNGAALKLLADSESNDRLHRIYSRSYNRVLLVIGPEGGWVPFETGLFLKQGFQPFALGPWVLRVETAVTAALALIEQVRFELSGK